MVGRPSQMHCKCDLANKVIDKHQEMPKPQISRFWILTKSGHASSVEAKRIWSNSQCKIMRIISVHNQ